MLFLLAERLKNMFLKFVFNYSEADWKSNLEQDFPLLSVVSWFVKAVISKVVGVKPTDGAIVSSLDKNQSR